MNIHRPLVAVPSSAPHSVEQLLARQRQSGVGSQELQQLEFPGGQGDNLTGDSSFPPGAVDLDRPDEDDPRRLTRPVGAPQDGPDASDEFPGEKGLVT